jgi:hypothetical protein
MLFSWPRAYVNLREANQSKNLHRTWKQSWAQDVTLAEIQLPWHRGVAIEIMWLAATQLLEAWYII